MTRIMTREEVIEILKSFINVYHICREDDDSPSVLLTNEDVNAFEVAIKAVEQESRKGKWLRMSDLSEQEDDRYKCSRCGNAIHHKSKVDLYTFNSWCGRCGSDNGRYINYEVEE